MTLQFAPVAPLEALKLLAAHGELGNYQLVIAPIVLERRHEYYEFFKEHDDQFVILDNGVIETGAPLTGMKLAVAAWDVGAQLVVMPDAIDDGPETLRLTLRGLTEFRLADHAIDTMGVVQGRSLGECEVCALQLTEMGVDWLAIPRGLTKNLGTRTEITKMVGDECGLPMHLLGWSDNVEDDMLSCQAHPLVRGNDAATPVWLASQAGGWLPIMPPLDSRGLGRRPKDFWQPATGLWALGTMHHEQLVTNVRTVHQWLDGAQTALPVPVEPVVQMGQPTPTL
jgi:hypothetical protein